MNAHNGIAKDKPVLLIVDGPLRGHQWTIHEESVVIGRGPECQIAIPDRSVSREHARVTANGGQFYLEDLGSKNGTHVNGNNLSGRHELKDGDEIQIAVSVKIKFIGSDATVPLAIDAAQPAVTGFRLDPHTHEVYLLGKLLDPPLSLYQYRLLELLYERHGGIVTREEVVRTVWPEAATEGVSEQAIDALVRRLRDRLAEIAPDVTHITTVRGHGFRMMQQTERSSSESSE